MRFNNVKDGLGLRGAPRADRVTGGLRVAIVVNGADHLGNFVSQFRDTVKRFDVWQALDHVNSPLWIIFYTC
jgi:hypothetical protein